jgi:hypothetical protein
MRKLRMKKKKAKRMRNRNLRVLMKMRLVRSFKITIISKSMQKSLLRKFLKFRNHPMNRYLILQVKNWKKMLLRMIRNKLRRRRIR